MSICETGGEELRGVKTEKTWRRSMSQAGTTWVVIAAVVSGWEAHAGSLGKRQVHRGFGKCSLRSFFVCTAHLGTTLRMGPGFDSL